MITQCLRAIDDATQVTLYQLHISEGDSYQIHILEQILDLPVLHNGVGGDHIANSLQLLIGIGAHIGIDQFHQAAQSQAVVTAGDGLVANGHPYGCVEVCLAIVGSIKILHTQGQLVFKCCAAADGIAAIEPQVVTNLFNLCQYGCVCIELSLIAHTGHAGCQALLGDTYIDSMEGITIFGCDGHITHGLTAQFSLYIALGYNCVTLAVHTGEITHVIIGIPVGAAIHTIDLKAVGLDRTTQVIAIQIHIQILTQRQVYFGIVRKDHISLCHLSSLHSNCNCTNAYEHDQCPKHRKQFLCILHIFSSLDLFAILAISF